MIGDLLCTIKLHKWVIVRKSLVGLSLYEEETCRRCGAKSTVISGIVDAKRIRGHLTEAGNDGA